MSTNLWEILDQARREHAGLVALRTQQGDYDFTALYAAADVLGKDYFPLFLPEEHHAAVAAIHRYGAPTGGRFTRFTPKKAGPISGRSTLRLAGRRM